MDKLQPIIKNRFWILAGLVLPLAMYGFFSANSKLKAATETREGELKSVLSNVPGGTNDANQKYADGLKKINEVYSETVEDSIIGIWQTQQQRMDWPPVVETYLPSLFLGEFDYRGIVAYQEAYERLMRDLQSRVEPVMPLEQANAGIGVGGVRPTGPEQLADVPWKQKVILAASIPQANFGRMRATSEEVWNAQIDIWLLRLLFDAVARLNEDKDSATEAILRRIDVLQLVGGNGEPVVTGGDSSGGGSSGYGEEMYDGGEMSGGSSGYGGGSSKSASATKVPIQFSPAQEFGSAADESGGGGDESGDSYGGMTGGASQNANQLRYIADEEGKPYLERGFYMSVIIMQDKIPDFLVELANSEWPVRVTRFHVGKNPYYTGAVSSGAPYGNSFGDDDYTSGDMETFSGRGSATYGAETPFGGVGANIPGIEGVGSLTQNLPKMADDAMQHPNLVQLDLCGVITMYKQPQTIVDAIENGETLEGGSATEVASDVDPATATDPGLPADPASSVTAGEASPTVSPTDAEATTPESPEPANPDAADGNNPPLPAETTDTLELENL